MTFRFEFLPGISRGLKFLLGISRGLKFLLGISGGLFLARLGNALCGVSLTGILLFSGKFL